MKRSEIQICLCRGILHSAFAECRLLHDASAVVGGLALTATGAPPATAARRVSGMSGAKAANPAAAVRRYGLVWHIRMSGLGFDGSITWMTDIIP